MDSPTWQRIEEIFSAALDRPESERPEFVRDACGGNAKLREEIEAMLDAAGEDDGASLSIEIPNWLCRT